MIIQFKEVEPYNNTGKDPEELRGFFTGIPANSNFEFDGNTKPKCMLINNMIYKETFGMNTTQGVLLSIDLDTYFDHIDDGKSESQLLQSYGIGEIRIEYRTEDYPPKLKVIARAKKF